MVKDHQQRVCPESFVRRISPRQLWGSVPAAVKTPGVKRLQGADNSRASNSHGLFDRTKFSTSGVTWSALVLLICGGCQSGLVDPGRSRGAARAPQAISPPVMGPQPVTGQPQTIDGVPPATGATPPDWAHVARQPAANVVQLSPHDNAKPQYHTVQAGETWSSLARQHGLTVKQLADANGIDPSAILKQGQIVYLPESGRRAESP